VATAAPAETATAATATAPAKSAAATTAEAAARAAATATGAASATTLPGLTLAADLILPVRRRAVRLAARIILRLPAAAMTEAECLADAEVDVEVTGADGMHAVRVVGFQEVPQQYRRARAGLTIGDAAVGD